MSRLALSRQVIPFLAALSLLVVPALACSMPVQVAPAPAGDVRPGETADGAVAAEAMASEADAPALSAPPPAVALMAGEDAPPRPTPDMMFFEDYGVNPFIDTEDDNLSTFALDVDTGSYTVVRRYVQDGLLPPDEAVRVEEFVNYFEYGYPIPERDQTFAIIVDGSPSPFGETDRYEMVRVGLQGYEIPAEMRKDVVLTFVIDVSGSMDREDRLTLVKRALTMLVEELRPADSVAIVVYGSSARSVLPSTRAAEKNDILDAIYDLQPEGSTNAAAGLQMAYMQAAAAFNPEANNRVVLLSDGVANVGETGPEAILDTIAENAERGIYLTTVGFGMGNYNDVLMEQLADQGDGFYAYVDGIDEARRLFVHDLTGTLETIARDAKIQVDFNPDVVARYRLLGFENRAIRDEQFRDDTVDAGEIGSGHSVTALYEVKRHLDDEDRNVEGRMATVYLRWQDPDSGEVHEISQDLHSGDLAPTFPDAAPSFQLAIVVSELAEVLRKSYWAQENTLAGVLEEAQRVGNLLEENPDVRELVELVRRAAELA